MKRKLILLISVLFLMLNLAGTRIIEVPEAVGGVMLVAGGTPAGGSAFQHEETFDTNAGYDLGACGSAPCWTEGSAVDEDSTADCLSSECLDAYISSVDTLTKLDITADLSPAYSRFWWKADKNGAGQHVIAKWIDSGDVIVCEVRVSTGETFEVRGNGCSTTQSGSADYISGTAYYIWLEWTAATSGDGVCSLYYSTTGSKSQYSMVQVSNCDSTTDADELVLENNDGAAFNNWAYFDNVIIDSSAIGDP